MKDQGPFTSLCEEVPWDSAWFGFTIGRVVGERLTLLQAQEAETWCAARAVRCLYFLADANHYETAIVATQFGFLPVDVRVTLRREIARGRKIDLPAATRESRDSDLPVLKAMARELHFDSRFLFDRGFPRERAREMFARWVERCAMNPRGALLVIEESGTPAGYCGCELIRDDAGSIALFGIRPESQGAGLGSALLISALNWFQKRGVTEISVVTQLRNPRSLNLYEKHGFRVVNVRQWYHKWLPAVAGGSPGGPE